MCLPPEKREEEKWLHGENTLFPFPPSPSPSPLLPPLRSFLLHVRGRHAVLFYPGRPVLSGPSSPAMSYFAEMRSGLRYSGRVVLGDAMQYHTNEWINGATPCPTSTSIASRDTCSCGITRVCVCVRGVRDVDIELGGELAPPPPPRKWNDDVLDVI